MDLIFPDQGLVFQLSQTLQGGVRYHLFTNNIVPALGTTLADLVEATWAGYANVLQSWSDYTTTGVSGHNGFAIAPPINFGNTSGSPQSAYGYYVTDAGITLLLAVAAFDSPPVVIPNGGSESVVPTWGNLSELSS